MYTTGEFGLFGVFLLVCLFFFIFLSAITYLCNGYIVCSETRGFLQTWKLHTKPLECFGFNPKLNPDVALG